LPLAEIGELDALAAHPRDLVPREHLRLERRHQRMQRLLARIDAQPLRLARFALPRAEAEQVAGPDEQRPDRERPPALAPQLQLDGPLLPGTKEEGPHRRAFLAE